MSTLDFDIVGIIFFLWAIMSGILSSKEAKKKKAERERSRPKSKTKARPQVFEQPKTEKKWETKSEPPKETIPMPDWFPFPIEIPKEVVKEVKQMVKPSKPALQEESRKQVPQPPEVKKKVIPTVIEAQEKQWKTSENYGLNLDTKSVVNGIVWSEVLGPPRAKKKYNFR